MQFKERLFFIFGSLLRLCNQLCILDKGRGGRARIIYEQAVGPKALG